MLGDLTIRIPIKTNDRDSFVTVTICTLRKVSRPEAETYLQQFRVNNPGISVYVIGSFKPLTEIL